MITVTNLVKRFADGTGIAYGDMVFETGKSYVLLGASGCGKSTLLNMIAGIITPTEGVIDVDGRCRSTDSKQKKDAFRISDIGIIFQDFKLIDEMTVRDNIELLKLEHVDVSEMQNMLDKLGIGKLADRRVSHLSGGEKQRTAIARALVKKPRLILADEPTGNLNYSTGRLVAEQLISVSQGKTLICVTHDERLAELFDVRIDMNHAAHPVGGEGNA